MYKSFELFDSDSLKDFHKRIFFSMIVFLFVYFVAIYRIVEIMLFTSKNENIVYIENFKERGNIYDRNGNLLATSIISKSLSVNPYDIKKKKDLAKKLSNILNIKEDFLFEKLSKNKKFVWVKRNINPKEHQKIIDLGEINLRIHNERKRIYPYSNLTSHSVGYVNIDGIGQSGVERSLNKQLSQSKDVYLTLDVNLQYAVREELMKSLKHFKAESGIAIILDIEEGDIITSVSLPDFDPNNKLTFDDQNLINRVIQSNYEMGSTFKPLTVVMGFDKDLISPEMTFDITDKIKGIGDFKKYEGNGIYNVEKIITHSSNIGAAQIAAIVGKKNQKEFFEKIGFLKKINIEILEAAEPLGNKNNWGETETMTIGFGHGFAITPLHLVKAYGSIANKGYEVNPSIILGTKNKLRKQLLLKENTSDYFLELLSAVVNKTKITGPKIKLEGYDIGGKTGTSELINNKQGSYYKDRNLTSFISVFPINEPKYVVLTMLEYPKQINEISSTGANVNAPLSKKIILRMIEVLKIPMNFSDEILNADIKHLYKYKNVTF